ncbi:hypothetical protein A0H81_07923 [Grifola frondosa]|uniref:Uncharacterized protein n=1 Tax=Grifola frondosa TaxID=5627 RepID=A0A1C7M5Q2_GRIFR|nr:hypothetical protein A0H81_07923 [Grifola frondosa]
MSPSNRKVRNLKVHVPRHNSQRIGPAVTAHVESLARSQRMRVDVRQTAFDPSSALAQAIDSASEWNSLLMTARAERGPQWDIGTQQYVSADSFDLILRTSTLPPTREIASRFLVDEFSELYYDPTPLRSSYQNESRSSNDDPPSAANPTPSSRDIPSTPRVHRTPVPHNTSLNTPTSQTQYYNAPPPLSSPRHAYPGVQSGYGNMNPMPNAQFYGGGEGSAGSPMRPGMGMLPPGMGVNPGMGMGMGGMGMSMGMNMGMGQEGGISPEMRRRMTRGMGMEDGFGGMHG